jgi:4-diphosphocytidyl-2C-methyl-D-erythritol kinase
VLPAPAKLNLFVQELGADVPFLRSAKQRARGIGEVLEAVGLPQTGSLCCRRRSRSRSRRSWLHLN